MDELTCKIIPPREYQATGLHQVVKDIADEIGWSAIILVPDCKIDAAFRFAATADESFSDLCNTLGMHWKADGETKTVTFYWRDGLRMV